MEQTKIQVTAPYTMIPHFLRQVLSCQEACDFALAPSCTTGLKREEWERLGKSTVARCATSRAKYKHKSYIWYWKSWRLLALDRWNKHKYMASRTTVVPPEDAVSPTHGCMKWVRKKERCFCPKKDSSTMLCMLRVFFLIAFSSFWSL